MKWNLVMELVDVQAESQTGLAVLEDEIEKLKAELKSWETKASIASAKLVLDRRDYDVQNGNLMVENARLEAQLKIAVELRHGVDEALKTEFSRHLAAAKEVERLAELLSKDAARIEYAEDLAEKARQEHAEDRAEQDDTLKAMSAAYQDSIGVVVAQRNNAESSLVVAQDYTAKLEALLKEIGAVTTPSVEEGDVFLWLTPSEDFKDEDEENWVARRDALLKVAP